MFSPESPRSKATNKPNLLSQIFLGKQEIENPGAIQLYRILYGLSNVIFAANTFDQFDLLFFPLTTLSLYTLKFLVIAWIIGGAVILLTRPPKLYFAIHYIITLLVITSSLGQLNVEGKFFMTASFFNIFLPIQRKSILSKSDFQIILLCFITLSAYLFYGGALTKISDPVWREGLGYYYVALLPWIKNPLLNFILRDYTTVVIINWVVIFVEVAIFFTAILYRTRHLAIILFLTFGFHLCFVLWINTIGFQAIAFTSLFFSIYNKKIKLFSLFEKLDLKIFSYLYNHIPSIPFEKDLVKFLIVVFFIIFARVTIYAIYPSSYSNNAIRFFDLINSRSFNILNDHLFTATHFAHISEFKVKVKMSDGSIKEPVVVFNDDKTAGPASSSLLASRWIQAEMYRITKTGIRQMDSISHVVPYNTQRLLKYIYGKATKNGNEVVSMHLYLTPLVMPKEFSPSGPELVASGRWEEVVRYFPKTGKYEVIQ